MPDLNDEHDHSGSDVKPAWSDWGFHDRLKYLLAKEKSTSAFARKAGLSQSGLHRIEAGGDPTLKTLIALADAAGVSIQWLATGQGSPSGAPQPIAPSDEPAPEFDQDFALIPRYEVNLSAGPGLVPDHEHVEERLAFSRVWLSRNRINPAHAGLVRVRGDSMAPTLPDGALALVNTAEARLDREGVYAFSRDGEAFVKRLVPVAIGPGGTPTSIVIISDGGTIPPEMISGPALGDLRIVGRVRCILVNM